MPTEKEIKTKYKQIHDELTAEFYPIYRAGLPTDELMIEFKAVFDASHGQNWADMEAELIAEGYMPAPEPTRDLAAELDELKARVEGLE